MFLIPMFEHDNFFLIWEVTGSQMKKAMKTGIVKFETYADVHLYPKFRTYKA